MKGPKSYLINVGIILIIGAISMYISVGKEFKSVFKTVLTAKPSWLLLLALVMLTYYVVDGISMWIAGKTYKKDYTLKEGFVTGMIGTLFSDITPSASGGQFAQIFIYNNQGIPPTVSSGILMACFIAFQIVIVCYSAAVILFHSGYFLKLGQEILSMAYLGYAINIVVTIALFGGAMSKKLQHFIVDKVIYFLSKIKIVKNYEATSLRIRDYFDRFRHTLGILMGNKKLLFEICVCDAIKLTLLYSTPYLSCKALGIAIPPKMFANFIGLASIIHLINAFLPIPGASGGSEGAFMIIFGFLGQVESSSAMMLWRFSSFYYGALLGLITFIFAKDVKKRREPTITDIEDH